MKSAKKVRCYRTLNDLFNIEENLFEGYVDAKHFIKFNDEEGSLRFDEDALNSIFCFTNLFGDTWIYFNVVENGECTTLFLSLFGDENLEFQEVDQTALFDCLCMQL